MRVQPSSAEDSGPIVIIFNRLNWEGYTSGGVALIVKVLCGRYLKHMNGIVANGRTEFDGY